MSHLAEEQARVRALVAELVRDALQTGHKVRYRVLRERLTTLREAVEHAIVVEEEELVPMLSCADAWGNARVDRVRERHARLLDAVREFEADVTEGRHRPCDVVAHVDDVVAALDGEMEEEETALRVVHRGEDGDTVTEDQEDA